MDLHKRCVRAVVDHVNFIDPPVDFSFLKLAIIEAALDESPKLLNVSNKKREILKKRKSGQFKSNTLHLNNNGISDCVGLNKVLDRFFVNPKLLKFLNLSYNLFKEVPNELLELEQLQILYLHGNSISKFDQIAKFQILDNFRSLTLHGNPLEQEYKYRTNVLILLPNLRSLDFSDVTAADLFLAETTKADRRISRLKANRRQFIP